MNKLYFRTWFLSLSVLLLLACTPTTQVKQVEWTYQPPGDFTVVNAVGYAPISQQRGADNSAKQLRAMKASKLDAYRELSEQVYGQHIDSTATISDMVLGNERLAASVAGVIRGAKVVNAYAVDDVYVTELQLDFREVYRVTMSMAPTRHLDSQKTVQF
ncbi:LPP20 family lipoprotein [Agarivorans sp. MS3-6]|uniref:LPP20 family lipoprotein n=1 Tax=Agarivorans sp. TSD2052 TaxID=2937286 RepID=UPI00200C2834|nr:LPP20 family lipoprotein [Agarivorans sp. TSD2052]UPW20137.1 LPP20 family lipoprotein [Agarivorans sp. TSD2052]